VEFAGDQLCKRLAMEIQRDLDEYIQVNPEFPVSMVIEVGLHPESPLTTPFAQPQTSEMPRPRGVLFVVDRSMDPVAPFLHEFTYQAMVNDLLPIEDGRLYK
jgi:syntaxin-binding protein 1